MKTLACIVFLLSFAAYAGEEVEISSPPVDGALRKIEVNGAELHYVATGDNPAMIFVHGGLADYRELLPVARQLQDRYAAICYSRRHSHPNRENPVSPDHSPITEANDLAALIEGLGLQPTHVVGVSYGASTSLFLALRHPRLVRSLTLVEPPLVSWLPGIAGGQAVYDDFYNRLVTPVRAAFQAGDRDAAFRLTLEYFVGPSALEQIPPDILANIRLNLRDWEVMFNSRDLLPHIAAADLRKLELPVQMLSGGSSYELGKLVDAELERTLPKVRRVLIPEGTHDACVEKPDICAREISAFLDGFAD
jgi:pimeloyl-ACP methyl ester carboxylesterase